MWTTNNTFALQPAVMDSSFCCTHRTSRRRSHITEHPSPTGLKRTSQWHLSYQKHPIQFEVYDVQYASVSLNQRTIWNFTGKNSFPKERPIQLSVSSCILALIHAKIVKWSAVNCSKTYLWVIYSYVEFFPLESLIYAANCNCVLYYMPRNNDDITICGRSDDGCIYKVTQQLQLKENKSFICECLPAW